MALEPGASLRCWAMAKHVIEAAPPAQEMTRRPRDVQHAQLGLRLGDRTNLSMEVTVTSTGILAVGALVSGILLSSAVIVLAARTQRPPV
jgi:hypothetical protein